MKKILSLIMPVTLAALFIFADTASALQEQQYFQVEAYEGGGGTGGYVPSTTTTCGPGQYRSGSSCLSCGPGTYKTGTNTNTSCTSCPAGTYSPSATYSGNGFSYIASCWECPAGSYASGTGNTTCTACPEGTYRSSKKGTSVSSCTSCPEGTTSPAASTSSSACVAVISGNCPSGMTKSGDYCINSSTAALTCSSPFTLATK